MPDEFIFAGRIWKIRITESIWDKYNSSLPASFIAARSFIRRDQPYDLEALLQTMIGDLAVRVPPINVTIPKDFREITDKDQLAKFVLNLVLAAADWGMTTLVLLDDFDQIPENDGRWIARFLFGPLIRTHKVVIILSSEFELRFTYDFELRLHMESYGINPWELMRSLIRSQ